MRPLEAGDPITFHHADGSSASGKVVKPRGGVLYDLAVDGVAPSETQMVPHSADFDANGRRCEEVGEMRVPAEAAAATHALALRPPPPMWPIVASLAVSVAALGIAILSLALR